MGGIIMHLLEPQDTDHVLIIPVLLSHPSDANTMQDGVAECQFRVI